MIPFQNPTIWLGNIRIDEPITTLTDILFVTVCIYTFIKTKNKSNALGVNLYRYFFLITGFSTLISALIGHAFLYYFGLKGKCISWEINILSVSIASFAAIYHTRNTIHKKLFIFLILINLLETLYALIFTGMYPTFVIVEIHSAFCLLIMVTILESRYYHQTKSKISKHLLLGVTIAILAVLVHIFKLAISNWFNHMDLSHIIMCISVYVMHKGILLENNKLNLA